MEAPVKENFEQKMRRVFIAQSRMGPKVIFDDTHIPSK